MRWHHCGILSKYIFFTFENVVTYSNMNKNVYIIMFHLCSLNWSVDAITLVEQHKPLQMVTGLFPNVRTHSDSLPCQ